MMPVNGQAPDDAGAACPEGGLPWVLAHLGQCVSTPEQMAGFVCGLLAVTAWLVAHCALLVIRHRRFRAKGHVVLDYAMFHQTVADICNCVGAILAKQLLTQSIFGVYLLMMDVILFVQSVVFKLISGLGYKGTTHQAYHGQKSKRRRTKQRSRLVPILLLPWCFALFYVFPATWGWLPAADVTPDAGYDRHGAGRVLMASTETVAFDLTVSLGYSLGIFAAVFDLTATFPHILHVFQEKSFSGLDVIVFASCIVGNCLYVVGVFTQGITFNLIWRTLPWTVARLGLIGIQSSIIVQLCLNRRHRAGRELEDEVVSLLRNEYPNLEEELQAVTSSPPYKPKKSKHFTKKKSKTRYSDEVSDSSDSLGGAADEDRKLLWKPPVRGRSASSSSQSVTTNDLLTPVSSDIEDSMHLEIWNEDLTEEQVFNILSAEDEERESPERGADSTDTPQKGEDVTDSPQKWEDVTDSPQTGEDATDSPARENRESTQTDDVISPASQQQTNVRVGMTTAQDSNKPRMDYNQPNHRLNGAEIGKQAPDAGVNHVPEVKNELNVLTDVTSLGGETHWWSTPSDVEQTPEIFNDL